MWLWRGQSGLWYGTSKYWHNPSDTGEIIFTLWPLNTQCLQMSLTELLLFAIACPFSVCIVKHSGKLCLTLDFWKHLVYFWEIFTASCISPLPTQLTILIHICNGHVLKTYSVPGIGFSIEYTIKSKIDTSLPLWNF